MQGLRGAALDKALAIRRPATSGSPRSSSSRPTRRTASRSAPPATSTGCRCRGSPIASTTTPRPASPPSVTGARRDLRRLGATGVQHSPERAGRRPHHRHRADGRRPAARWSTAICAATTTPIFSSSGRRLSDLGHRQPHAYHRCAVAAGSGRCEGGSSGLIHAARLRGRRSNAGPVVPRSMRRSIASS